ncbi:MAG: hypothetical protein ACRCXC_11200 [Legionella sp.]
MTKLYAIVNHPYTNTGNQIFDLSSYLVKPLHDMMYEQVCVYSLGNEIEFFESLEEAKKKLEAVVKVSKMDYKIATQKAVLELYVDEEEKITGFCKLYVVEAEELFEKTQRENRELFK